MMVPILQMRRVFREGEQMSELWLVLQSDSKPSAFSPGLLDGKDGARTGLSLR